MSTSGGAGNGGGRAGRTASPATTLQRRHPALRPWDELPPDVQEQNREGIRALPDVLSDSGFELIRLAPPVPVQRRGPVDAG